MPLRQRFDGHLHQPHTHDVLESCMKVIVQAGLRNMVHTRASAHRVARSGGRWLTGGLQVPSGSFTVSSKVVVLCINNRLGIPRSVTFRGEGTFRGQIRRGLSGDTDDLDWARKRVVILGMGAYAVENMRTALEQNATFALVLCRQRATVSPRPNDWINQVRPIDGDFRRHPGGDTVQFGLWVKCYSACRAISPVCWREGRLKPDGHGLSVGDMFFVGHHGERASTQIGRVDQLAEDGIFISEGHLHRAQILVKCVGFHMNLEAEKLLGHSHTTADAGWRTNLMVLAEPYLDRDSHTDVLMGSTALSNTVLMARLFFQHWKGYESIGGHSRLQQIRIDQVRASDGIREFRKLLADADMRYAVRSFHADVQSGFHASASPYTFLTRHRQEWKELHLLLDPLHRQEDEAPYLFFELLDVLGKEVRTYIKRMCPMHGLETHTSPLLRSYNALCTTHVSPLKRDSNAATGTGACRRRTKARRAQTCNIRLFFQPPPQRKYAPQLVYPRKERPRFCHLAGDSCAISVQCDRCGSGSCWSHDCIRRCTASQRRNS
jgi:hypothetical protein